MSVICVVVVLSLLAVAAFCLSVAEIVVGSVYVNNCIVERYIPIYLIVSGCVGLVLAVIGGKDAHRTHAKGKESGGDSETSHLQSGGGGGSAEADDLQKQSGLEKCWSAVRGLLSLFAIIWMICGMYWVLNVLGKWSSNPDSLAYCNPNLYRFALAMVFVRLGLLVAMFLLSCCVCCGFMRCTFCLP